MKLVLLDKPVTLDINMIFKIVFLFAFFEVNGLQLKQVVVLSRHNIRSPLAKNLDFLTPKKWPVWNGTKGDLTPKGRILEYALGKYFADWMNEEKFNCTEDEVFVFSNTNHRTIESAKAFSEGGFGDSGQVYYKNMTEMDPIFNPIVRNNSKVFKEKVFNEMQKNLNKVDVNDAFLRLNEIVDIEDSAYCLTEDICDLSKAKNEIVLKVNEEPDVFGAMKFGNILVDAILMAYYEGKADNDVAWGGIKSIEDLASLVKIPIKYHELRFATKYLNKDTVSTMLAYLTDVFLNGKKKFYLLVGHESNIVALMSTLRFRHYDLPGQFEKTPIGGKIVFEKWLDEENDQELLRVRYLYQSTRQIRDGVEASSLNPPLWALLEMENCAVDENGFCPWNDFLNVLSAV